MRNLDALSKCMSSKMRCSLAALQGEPVHDKPNTVRLKLQINSNAESPTLRKLAAKAPHRTISNVDVDSQQDVTEENLKKMKEEFLNNLDL